MREQAEMSRPRHLPNSLAKSNAASLNIPWSIPPRIIANRRTGEVRWSKNSVSVFPFSRLYIIGGGKSGKTVFPPGFPSGKYLGIPKEMQISESFVEITQKWENGFPSQGWENRLALPEHLLTPINLNIVIRSFPHHNPIFREVVNQFGLNAITMLFSAAVCGRNCREKALDETVPFNPSKRARQWMAASLSIHQRELVNGSTDARRWIEASASMD